MLVVIALGFVLHRPLARLPESHLKYAVGVVLSCFGVFFLGEGLGAGVAGRRRRRCSTSRGAFVLAAQVQVARAPIATRKRRLKRALRKLVFGETWTLPLGVGR